MSIGTVAMVLQVFPALNSKIVVLTASSKTPLVLTPPRHEGGGVLPRTPTWWSAYLGVLLSW